MGHEASQARRTAVEDAVKACYSTWGDTYFEDYYGSRASYPPVHVDLVRRLLKQAGARTVLEAGCGPASFLRMIAGEGFELYGFDLTPEMLEEGKRVFSELKLPPENLWLGSVVERSAFKAPGAKGPELYDAIVSIGVLPHITREDEPKVLANALDSLKPGGLAVLEARNELFALFTLNRYSHAFFAERLICADGLRAKAGPEASALEASLGAFEGMFRMDLPPRRAGGASSPGYDEVLSRTHNPLELKSEMQRTGFEDVEVLFYHFHCLPPMFGGKSPQLFLRESLAMEADPADWRGYFMASAFVVTGRRP